MTVTYGRLDEVLRSLGFSASVFEETALIYRHKATGALIGIPRFPPDNEALPRHLMAARFVLDNYGIADPLDFDAELRKAG